MVLTLSRKNLKHAQKYYLVAELFQLVA